MKVLVAVKRVIDYRVKVRLNSDQTAIETHQVKHGLNPFDEIALEQAIRWLEAGLVSEVVAVTCASASDQEVLRTALAMGATQAVLLESQLPLAPLQVAQALAAFQARDSYDLLMLGKQAIDNDCNQVPQMLAGLLRCPQGTFASQIEFSPDKESVLVTRETDRGLETIRLSLPAVISSDLRLCEPRFIGLPQIMKAKSKSISVVPLTELIDEQRSCVKHVAYAIPPVREAGQRLNSLHEVLSVIQERGGL